MAAARLLYGSQGKEHRASPAPATAPCGAKLWLTLPHPGGQGSEAALVIDRGRPCDRNRGGIEQDEF